jgi:hypothetical protein
MQWSVRCRRTLRTRLFNIDSMSIYKEGVIMRELRDGEMWEVEILHSTPTDNSCIMDQPPFRQKGNFVNYSF